MGTGLAAYLAFENNPSLLILKAPYYSMSYMRKLYYNWLPEFGLRYKFTTNKYIVRADLPVIIFHGDEDELIPYECSLKLQELFDGNDILITLKGQNHHQISKNEDYIEAINEILE